MVVIILATYVHVYLSSLLELLLLFDFVSHCEALTCFSHIGSYRKNQYWHDQYSDAYFRVIEH